MKIVRVFPTFQNDFKYTEHYLAKELKKVGHATLFLTSDRYLSSWNKYLTNREPVGFYSYDHYDVIRLKSFFPKEKVIFLEWKKLFKLLFKNDVSVIHILGVGTFTTLLVLVLSFFAGNNYPPIIISDHTDKRTHSREGRLAELYYRLLGLLFGVIGTRVDRIITFSAGSVDVLSNRFGIDKKRFSIIPLGYDQDVFYYKSDAKNTRSKFTIGFAGKIDAKKRVDLLLQVLTKLSFASEIHIKIAGVVEDEYCNNLISFSKGAAFTSEFIPFVKTNELASFYNSLDLAVFPGGISITTIEASACGVPVIIYESIQGLNERVDNGRGILFSTEEELSNAINSYYLTWKKGNIQNEKISELTRENYSWEKLKFKYLEVYECSIGK